MTPAEISAPDAGEAGGAASERAAAPGPAGVVLIHGLARSSGSMWLLARRLERAGFVTARIAYPSTRLPLERAVAHVAARVTRLAQDWGTIHLVGHSLGGVIARLLAERHPELATGRIVQLGSPNDGSALARRVRRLGIARAVLGPALDDIATLHGPGRQVPRVGAIAGRMPIDLLGEAVGLDGPNDGFVTVRSAWEGAEQRLAIPSVHGWMPLSPAVGREVVRFLKEGRFAGQRR